MMTPAHLRAGWGAIAAVLAAGLGVFFLAANAEAAILVHGGHSVAVPDSDLAGFNFVGAMLTYAILTGLNMKGKSLAGVDLSGANLKGADLTGIDLAGVNLKNANLKGANFRGVNLTGAHLEGANLTDVNLEGAVCPSGSRAEGNPAACQGLGD